MLNSMKSDRLFAKGQILADKSQYEEAIRLFKEAAGLNPKHSAIHLHLGLAESQYGLYESAVESINRAITLSPSNPVYPAFLGLVHYDWQRYSEAISAFDQALAIDPEYTLPSFLKALTAMALGKIGEAYEGLMKQALNLGSLYQGRLLLLCESYLLAHQDEADKIGLRTVYIEKGLKSYPKNDLHRSLIRFSSRLLLFLNELSFDRKRVRVRRHVITANGLNRLAEWTASISEYQKALELNPHLHSVKEKLIEIYLETYDYEKALQYTVQLDEEEHKQAGTSPDDPAHAPSPYALALGVISFYLKFYDQAEENLTGSLKLDPTNYLPYYFLGICSLVKGDPKAAYSQLKKSVSLLNPKIIVARLEMAKKLNDSLLEKG